VGPVLRSLEEESVGAEKRELKSRSTEATFTGIIIEDYMKGLVLVFAVWEKKTRNWSS